MTHKFFSVILAVLIATSVSCRRAGDGAVTLAEISQEIGPRQESWDADLLISNDGIPRAILRADYWREYVDGDTTYTVLSALPETGNRVVAIMYDAEGEQSAEVVADEMQFFNDEDRFEAIGDVFVQTSTDRTLETEKLLWWESTGRIYAPGFVKLTAPRETIQGFELDSDESLENYTLGRVTGQILVED